MPQIPRAKPKTRLI